MKPRQLPLSRYDEGPCRRPAPSKDGAGRRVWIRSVADLKGVDVNSEGHCPYRLA